jgi:SEFIR domain
MASDPPKVFISYSHDSSEHTRRVRALADQLRADGIDAWIDQYAQDPDEGWVRWMRSQVTQANRVLLIFTEAYQRRFEGDEEEGKGLGATFEGVLVTQWLYENGGRNEKFRPVVFTEQDEQFIPLELRRFNRYRVDTPDHYQNLLRWMHEAPQIIAPIVGQKPHLPLEPTPRLFPDEADKSHDTKENPYKLLGCRPGSSIALPVSPPQSAAISNFPDRSPFFTGRAGVLLAVHKALAEHGRVALSGLGGVGKTQTAVEYGHRHVQEYNYVFWAIADSREALASSYLTVARLLNLPEVGAQDQTLAADAVKRWLASHHGWLIILDNADDLVMARAFIPPGKNGHVLLTTRARAAGAVPRLVEIQEMGTEEGALFLLRRSKYITPNALFEAAEPTDRARAKEIAMQLDGLPLALDQAAAYIEETGCGLSGYLDLYRKHAPELLRRRGVLASDHPEPVASTWVLSFENIEKANPAAAEVLRCCAFLDPPDGIPEEVFREGAPELGPTLGAVASDTLAWNDALSEILKYSLLRRDPNASTLEIHRLVQAVLKQGMDVATQCLWAERALRALGYKVHPDSISPDGKYGVFYCSNPAIVRYENSRMANYLVSVIPFRIIGALAGDIYFALKNRSNLSVTWTDDSSSALITVDRRWGPGSVGLIEIVNGKLVRQTNLLQKAIALLRPDCESCKSEPYNESFLFVISTQGDTEWSFDGASRVRIDCTGESNPKQLLDRKSWAARLQAVWDIKQAGFIQTKVTRILCGSYKDDSPSVL